MYTAVSQCNEPETYTEAIKSSESRQWKAAMQKEYDAIIKNETWKLTPLSAGQTVVGSKRMYKKKDEIDGQTRYKARLVAKGDSQIKGVDFDDPYALVVRFTSLRILFAYAAK